MEEVLGLSEPSVSAIPAVQTKYDIPSLPANVTTLRFFESGYDQPAYEDREYKSRFPESWFLRRALMLNIECYKLLKKPDQIIIWSEKYLKLAPRYEWLSSESSAIRTSLAEELSGLEQVDKAVEVLKEGLDLSGGTLMEDWHWNQLGLLASFLGNHGKHQELQELLRQCRELSGQGISFEQLMLLEGEAYFASKNWHRALYAYTVSLSLSRIVNNLLYFHNQFPHPYTPADSIHTYTSCSSCLTLLYFLDPFQLSDLQRIPLPLLYCP